MLYFTRLQVGKQKDDLCHCLPFQCPNQSLPVCPSYYKQEWMNMFCLISNPLKVHGFEIKNRTQILEVCVLLGAGLLPDCVYSFNFYPWNQIHISLQYQVICISLYSLLYLFYICSIGMNLWLLEGCQHRRLLSHDHKAFALPLHFVFHCFSVHNVCLLAYSSICPNK